LNQKIKRHQMTRHSKRNRKQNKGKNKTSSEDESENSKTSKTAVDSTAVSAAAPALRRSARRFNTSRPANTRISYAESDNDDDEEQVEEEENENDDEEEESDEAGDDESTDDSECEINDKSKANDDDESNLSCPHCHKKFKVVQGLDYHVKNNVCLSGRKKGRPKATNKYNTAGTKSKYRKIRGKLENRTCPNCKRVFTSVYGLSYHKSKKVCLTTPASEKLTTPKSWATLALGSKFVTPFGVVQVVHDTRATPKATLPDDLKPILKRYYSAISKRDAFARKIHSNFAVLSRARRALLAEQYESKTISAETVAHAYQDIYRAAARRRWEGIPIPTSATLEDPNYPDGSFPDRIVECVWIPDQRPRFVGADESEPMPWNPNGTTTPINMTLYLQRRMLSQVYSASSSLHYCPACGKCFGSKPGCKYHVDNCQKKSEKSKLEMQTKMESVDDRCRQLLAKIKFQASIHSSSEMQHPRTLTARIPKRKYVEIDRDNAYGNATSSAKPSVPFETPSNHAIQPEMEAEEDHGMKEETENVAEEKLEHPDDILAKMEADLHKYQGMLLGPVYPAVWHSLGYKKPNPKSSRRKRKAAPEKSKRQRLKTQDGNETVPPPPPPSQPQFEEVVTPLDTFVPSLDLSTMPPVIDTRVFVAEVEAGRYPSIKRYSGPHDNCCAICKQIELPSLPGQVQLLPCDFCKQSVHFACIRTKWTVKDPEPEDDFLCHSCIQVVIARRNRAEKRRLEKLSGSNATTTLEEVTTDPDDVELIMEVVPGREFECVAAQARRLEELTELLQDAKTRLSTNLHVSLMDRTRLALLQAIESEDALFR
jgi:hypothetical protein